MSKVLENTTISIIPLLELGIELPASSQYTIREEDYLLLATNDVIAELTPFINAGDVVVRDDTGAIPTTARMIDFLRYPDDAFGIRFLSNPERVNGFTKKNVQEAIEEAQTGFVGKGFQTSFVGNGTVVNEWMKSEDANIPSDASPDIFKFDARCIGIDWTNERQGADPIIIVCISNAGNGNDLDRFYKWELNNARVASKTNQTTGFTVNAGDKLAIYVRDGGTNSADAVLTMDFIVTNTTDQEIIENYSGDFNENTIPATNLIPEIFP